MQLITYLKKAIRLFKRNRDFKRKFKSVKINGN